ncbi:MAG: DNA recombination protein RmuC [Christensenellales bacterium]
MDNVILAISVVCVVLTAIVLIYIIVRDKKEKKNQDSGYDEVIDALGEAVSMVKENQENTAKNSREHIVSNINTANSTLNALLKTYMDNFARQIDDININLRNSLGEMKTEVKSTLSEMKVELKQSIGELKTEVSESLQTLRKDNEAQLEKMRETVDEKLSGTLEKRVNAAFEMVNSRLDAVQKGFGEMQSLSEKVANLNKSFSNIKTRGSWGEVALNSLLEQMLAPEQYKAQFNIKGKNMVDFAIVMPGQAGEKVYLPIDAKFPVEDYNRLVDATERGDAGEIDKERKQLKIRIKEEAKSIKEKYIAPPKTTNFAIIYLPSEGLYAEVVKDSELCNELQSKYAITVCGPSTIAALLNSLQMGFTTLKIQKKSAEVVKLMLGFKKDFTKFTETVGKARAKANDTVKELDSIDKRTDIIQKKLDKVDDLAGEYIDKNEDMPAIDGEAQDEI